LGLGAAVDGVEVCVGAGAGDGAVGAQAHLVVAGEDAVEVGVGGEDILGHGQGGVGGVAAVKLGDDFPAAYLCYPVDEALAARDAAGGGLVDEHGDGAALGMLLGHEVRGEDAGGVVVGGAEALDGGHVGAGRVKVYHGDAGVLEQVEAA